MTTPRVWIDEITFSDHTTLTLDKSDIVLVVGPNNSGKSAVLRGVRDKIENAYQPNPVVASVSLSKDGEYDDLLTWIASVVKPLESLPEPNFQALGLGMLFPDQLNSLWRGGPSLGPISRFFCRLVTADVRLQAANPAQNIAIVKEPPTQPIHYLLLDDRLEQKLSQQFKKAFGVDLVVHRNAGAMVPLLTGLRPVPGAGQDRLSFEYIQQLEKLTPLYEQGDGMRSFAGVLLYTSVGRESILLIDESEAFLHPPQARQLGRMLVDDKPVERQLFLATHSGEVLRGVLDANSDKVRVVRLRREGDVNIVKQLDNAKIAELWNDPLLRFSNILDGMFHEKVIICESDSDTRFYAAMSDAVIEAQGPDTRRPDIMFTHCGGKDRLAVVIRALREVDIPVTAVADFDVLRDEHPLRDIVEASGGDWAMIQPEWSKVKTAIDSKKPELSAVEVVKDIQEILGSVKEPMFPNSAREAIQKVFRRSSPWATAKEVGKAFVPPGQPTQACERLISSLKI